MAQLIEKPTVIAATGSKPKQIHEFFGRVNSGTDAVSVARMHSPAGWREPGQTPEFEELTLVLRGALHVETRSEVLVVRSGQAVRTAPGEWVRYGTPDEETEYVAICLPAFSPATVHRDAG